MHTEENKLRAHMASLLTVRMIDGHAVADRNPLLFLGDFEISLPGIFRFTMRNVALNGGIADHFWIGWPDSRAQDFDHQKHGRGKDPYPWNKGRYFSVAFESQSHLIVKGILREFAQKMKGYPNLKKYCSALEQQAGPPPRRFTPSIFAGRY